MTESVEVFTMAMLRYDISRLTILTHIAKMQLQPGSLLPSERKLAQSMKVSVGTIRRALDDLQSNGMIEKKHGLGSVLLRSIETSKQKCKVAFIYTNVKEKLGYDSYFRKTEDFSDSGFIVDYIESEHFDDSVLEAVKHSDGIFIMGHINKYWIDSLNSVSKPVVALGYHKYKHLVPTVDYDYKQSANIVTTAVIDAGATRIGAIIPMSSYRPSNLILEGYKTALSEYGLEYDEKLIIRSEYEDLPTNTDKFIDGKMKMCDAVILEHGSLLPFLMCTWRKQIKPDLIIGLADNYTSDDFIFEQARNFISCRFEESLAGKAIELFLDDQKRAKALKCPVKIKGKVIVGGCHA